MRNGEVNMTPSGKIIQKARRSDGNSRFSQEWGTRSMIFTRKEKVSVTAEERMESGGNMEYNMEGK